jgi:hypothetical protein
MLRFIFNIFLLLVILAAGYLAYAYYNYQKGEYRDLGIKYDIFTFDKVVKDKLKIEIKDKNELFYGAKIKGQGEQKVDLAFTNEEVSALVNFTNALKGRIKNFQIILIGNNDFEASFYYSDSNYKLFIPSYVKGSLSYTGGNSAYFKFNEIYLGDYKLPKIFCNRIANDFNIYVNNTIGRMDVFEIDRFEIEKNIVYFKGLLPTKIEGYE